MNLVIKLLVIISSIFISYIKTTSHHCCPNNGLIVSSTKCEDGSDVSLACEKHRTVLNPSRSAYYTFSIKDDEDNDGKSYLDAYNSGFYIHQPYFCIGDMLKMNVRFSNVAIACSSSRKWYHDAQVDGSAEVQEAKTSRILSLVVSIFNVISSVLLLTTAAIYYALPNLQGVQETCYFYFSLIFGLGHSLIFYKMIFNADGPLPNMCVSNLYILIYLSLCALCWSNVLNYHIWRTTMNYHTENEKELVTKYKIYAFGLPFLLIFLMWVLVHLKNMENLTFVLECIDHQIGMFDDFVLIPILLSILVSLLMFIHSQIRVWSSHTITLQDKKLTMKILKYRIFTNAKLFFVMGVPWTFLSLIVTSSVYLEYRSELINTIEFLITTFLIPLEGLPIFLVLVLFRKRVLRGMASRWLVNTKIFPDKWGTMRDYETEEEISDDETTLRRGPEAKYTANTDDKNNSTFDDTVVVNL